MELLARQHGERHQILPTAGAQLRIQGRDPAHVQDQQERHLQGEVLQGALPLQPVGLRTQIQINLSREKTRKMLQRALLIMF